MFYCNGQSIRNKKGPELDNILFNFDIICFSETWLDSKDFYLFNEFYTIRCDRADNNGHGGGVLILIRKQVNFEEILCNKYTKIDSVFVDLKDSNGKKIRLGVIYNPPHCSQSAFDELSHLFAETIPGTFPCIIVGDFNFPSIDWDLLTSSTANFSNDFLLLTQEYGLLQLVLEPTHIIGNTLDLVFCTEAFLASDLEVSTPFFTSDHNSVNFNFAYSPSLEQPAALMQYDFRKANFGQLNAFLEMIHWAEIFGNYSNVSEMYNIFLDVIALALENFVPRMYLCKKGSPWSLESKRAHRKKQKLYAKFKRTGRQIDFDAYKIATRAAQILARRDIFAHENRILQSGNPKKFWKYVNSKMRVRPHIPTLKNGQNSISDAREKAEFLNKYFVSVFIEDDGSTPTPPSYAISSFLDKINFLPHDVLRILKYLRADAACGPDKLPAILLKRCGIALCEPLASIFTVSFYTAQIPTIWSVAAVSAIYKGKGSISDCTNYRPISLTCIPCKIMESIIREKFFDHLDKNRLLSPHQHGFRPRRSTATQLLECLNAWTKTLDEKGQTDIIYLDFARAFDTVSHPKLICKLKAMGIIGNCLGWIQAFLANRTQYVYVDGQRSSKVAVSSGVPQGSVLSPVCFSTYINDLLSVLHFSSGKLYADDAKVYTRSDIANNPLLLQMDLDAISDWARKWQLDLSIGKCAVLHIARNPTRSFYSIGNTILTPSEYIKDLGVFISRNLKPSHHCQSIAMNALRTSACIFRNFTTRSHEFLTQMFVSFVRSKVEYATTVWSPWLQKDIDLIEHVQRSYTYRILHTRGNYAERLHNLNLESLEIRRLYFDLVEVFKIIHGISDISCHEFFEFSKGKTRGHNMKLLKKSSNCNERLFFFSNRIVNAWNSLSAETINATSINTFKRLLRSNRNLHQYLSKIIQ